MFDTFKCEGFDDKFIIKEARKDFFEVYFNNEFITSRGTLKQAQKLCKLLKYAYEKGFEKARDIYNEDEYH